MFVDVIIYLLSVAAICVYGLFTRVVYRLGEHVLYNDVGLPRIRMVRITILSASLLWPLMFIVGGIVYIIRKRHGKTAA